MNTRHTLRRTLISGVAIAGTSGIAAAQGIHAGSAVPHEFIVRAGSHEATQQVADTHSLTIIEFDDLSGRALVASDGSRPDNDELFDLAQDSHVDRIEPNRYFALSRGNTQSFFVGTMPAAYFDQPAITLIGAPAIRSIETGQGIVVAILDTGVQSHAVLDHVLLPGFNAILGTANASDVPSGADTDQDGIPDSFVGHGTMIAGVVHEVAPSASILPIKVLDSDGFGTTFDIAAGVRHAVASGAHVINLSLSSPVESEALEQALDNAHEAGVVVVASIGNNNRRETAYPAAFRGVIAVAATTMDDRRAPFSSYGSRVDICAPGIGLVGTMPDGGFAQADGCSFSCALVTGTAALLRDNIGSVPNIADLVWLRMANGAVPIDALNPAFARQLGVGRLSFAGIFRGRCPSDMDNGSHLGFPDQAVTTDDFVYFFDRFELGDVRVDVDNGSGDGTPDGTVDINDMMYFFTHFELGC